MNFVENSRDIIWNVDKNLEKVWT